MASTTIVIVDRDGVQSTELTASYRAADRGQDNVLSDSLTGALVTARRMVPNHAGAVWAIWPTGAGSFAIREVLKKADHPEKWITERTTADLLFDFNRDEIGGPTRLLYRAELDRRGTLKELEDGTYGLTS